MDTVIELLVKSGYDVNIQRPDGITALMIACRMVCNCAVCLFGDNSCTVINQSQSLSQMHQVVTVNSEQLKNYS